jgi:hypothetical protein
MDVFSMVLVRSLPVEVFHANLARDMDAVDLEHGEARILALTAPFSPPASCSTSPPPRTSLSSI